MRRISIMAAALAAALYGQGTIHFSTRVAQAGVDIPAFVGSPAGPAGPGPAFNAQLFLSANGVLTPVPESLTTFHDPTPNPILSRYIVPADAAVPGVPPGGSATFRIRAWLTAAGSYENTDAAWRGETIDFEVSNLGGNGAAPAYLPSTGVVNGFLILIPEPSAAAILLGGLAMLLFRRPGMPRILRG